MKYRSLSLFTFVIALCVAFTSSAEAHSIKVPPFSGQDTQGNTVQMSDFEGKTKVLYFWATWCPACRKETDAINKLQPMMKDKGIEFIAVSLDQDLDRLKNYIEQNNIKYPVLFDGQGWQNAIAQLYGVRATPSFYVIDSNNELVTEGSWNKQLEAYLVANS